MANRKLMTGIEIVWTAFMAMWPVWFLMLMVLWMCNGCANTASTRSNVLSDYGITVRMADTIPSYPRAEGLWSAWNRTIWLTPDARTWVLQHEIGHAADSLGNALEAIKAVGDVPGFSQQIQDAKRLAAGNPDPTHYWAAFRSSYGVLAVQHEDIIIRTNP